jgi:peptide/nickel transport system permease protein
MSDARLPTTGAHDAAGAPHDPDVAIGRLARVDDAIAHLDDGAALEALPRPPPMWRSLGPLFWVSIAWVLLICLIALLAPLLPLADPKESRFSATAEGPSATHPLGTDALGRDLLSRIAWGGQVSLAVGAFSVTIGLVLGGGLGLIAGYFRGRIETPIMVLADSMLSFPALVLLLALTTFLGQNLRNIIIAIGIVTVPVFLRLARAHTLTYAQREFVLAARATGARDARLIVKEVLPNVVLPLVAFSLIVVAVAIVAEGSLSFLGLSIPPTTPTWGNIIADGRQDLQTAPHIVFMPAMVMFLTVLAFNIAGDRLREVLDVREGAL